MALAKIKEIEAKYSAEIIEKIKKLYELTDDAGYISVKSGVDYYDTLEILGIEFGGEKYHAMISREHDAKVRGLIAQNRDEIYELLHSLGNNHDAEVLAYIQRKRLAEKRKI